MQSGQSQSIRSENGYAGNEQTPVVHVR